MGYRSLKVIQTGIIRKTGCSFLFTFHSNYGSILHHFPDIFESHDFCIPHAYVATVTGVYVGVLPSCFV